MDFVQWRDRSRGIWGLNPTPTCLQLGPPAGFVQNRRINLEVEVGVLHRTCILAKLTALTCMGSKLICQTLNPSVYLNFMQSARNLSLTHCRKFKRIAIGLFLHHALSVHLFVRPPVRHVSEMCKN